jgi:hypothetical protein
VSLDLSFLLTLLSFVFEELLIKISLQNIALIERDVYPRGFIDINPVEWVRTMKLENR